MDDAELRLLDQTVIVDVGILAGELVGEVTGNLVHPVRRHNLQKLEWFNFGLDVSPVGVEIEFLIPGRSLPYSLKRSVALTTVFLLLHVTTAFQRKCMQPVDLWPPCQRRDRPVLGLVSIMLLL